MRPRSLLVLLAVVAALASFIWFVDRDLPGSDERAEREKKVLALDSDSITRLEVESASGRVVFAREAGSDWRLVEPIQAAADQAAVDGLVGRLAGLEKERTFEEGSSAELGLEPPRAMLALSGPEGEERLLIGGTVPASSSMIVASRQQGPYSVVEAIEDEELDRPVDGWRSRSIFPGRREDIEGVTVESGGAAVTLARDGEDWALTAPIEDRADTGTVSRFVEALVGLEATEFVEGASGSDSDFGWQAAGRAVELRLAGEAPPWRLELGNPVTGDEGQDAAVYARADGHVYVVPDSLRQAFERPLDEWRSLEWATLPVFEIDRLDLEDASGELSLQRDGGDWRRDGVTIEYGPVSDLLYGLVGIKGHALGAETAVAGEPLMTLTLNPGDGAQVLRVYPPHGDSYPATASGRDAALWLGGDRIRSLVDQVQGVRAAASLPEPSEDAEGAAGAQGGASAPAASDGGA